MNSKVCLLLGAALALAGPASAQTRPEQCVVQIVPSAQDFETSATASARIESKSRAPIYLPSWSRALRVERVTASNTTGPPRPTVSELEAFALPNLNATAYSFKDNEHLEVNWADAGAPKDETSYVIPPGSFRFRLVYALVPPNRQTGSKIRLCTVYSQPFTLRKASEWSKAQ